jgi:subtilase family serine protease
MRRKSTEVDGAVGDDGAGSEYKVSEAVKVSGQKLSELVRTGWYSSGDTSAACRT